MLWVTGAKGLLGSTLLKRCERPCIGTGREVDISSGPQVEAFLSEHPEISGVVNCAAFSNVDEAEKAFDKAFQVNALGAELLAIFAKKKKVPFMHISTDYVFSREKGPPLSEEDPVNPCNVYGKTKLEGEQRVLEVGGCVIRTSWLFGKKGKNLISKLLLLLQKEEELRISDDQWNKFTYVPDLADAILQMLGKEGLYQFANHGVDTKYTFAKEMQKEAGRLGLSLRTKKILPAENSSFPCGCQRPTYSALDTTKIEKWVKIRHWKEAIKDFLCEELKTFL